VALTLDDLRGEVLGRATQRPCPVLHLLGEAEVCVRVRVRVRARVGVRVGVRVRVRVRVRVAPGANVEAVTDQARAS
jgi:hypothetical protein